MSRVTGHVGQCVLSSAGIPSRDLPETIQSATPRLSFYLLPRLSGVGVEGGHLCFEPPSIVLPESVHLASAAKSRRWSGEKYEGEAPPSPPNHSLESSFAHIRPTRVL